MTRALNEEAVGGDTRSGHLRTDIQALRGFAVGIVVLYHSGLGIAQSGYLGVDVFFVISGFLITGIVARQVEHGSFSFREFYGRRIRRILPATFAALLLTTIAAGLLLTSVQLRAYTVDLFASLLFSANISLWAKLGYFHPNAVFNPLLHMWSLAIEEQYYLLLPVALTTVPRKWWRPTVWVVSGASLLLLVLLIPIKPGIAFYGLPTRAWEIGLGSLAALYNGDKARLACRYFVIPALLALALLPFLPDPGGQRADLTLAVCAATAVIILARNATVDASLPARLLAPIGLISFSLYLVHWPLFALSRVARLSTDLPAALALLLIAIAIILAAFSYYFVERPFRAVPARSGRLFWAAATGSLLIAIFAIGVLAVAPKTAVPVELRTSAKGPPRPGCFPTVNPDFGAKCEVELNPEIIIWGDSQAAQLVPGLMARSRRPIVQASYPACAPIIGIAFADVAFSVPDSRGCLLFNENVLRYIAATPSVKVVVLSSLYSGELSGPLVLRPGRTQPASGPAPIEEIIARHQETVAALRELDKRVVMISNAPQSSFDSGECWLRKDERKPTFGLNRQCIFKTHDETEPMLLARSADVHLIRIADALCKGPICQHEESGMPLFSDTRHLTPTGSVLVAMRLDLAERLWTVAR